MLSRDLQRILKIRDYCLGIQDTIARFGNSPDGFLLDSDYQQSIAFSILQIGELTGGLSEEYRSSTKEQIQWPHIKGVRNIIVHDYGKIQLDRVWDIATKDIPVLKAFCNDQLPHKSQALNAHNFSLLVLSNFDKPTWPPSCPMVGSLRVFLFCSPCSAPLTSSPFDCPLCWFLPVTRSAQSPAGTPGT